MSIFAAFQKLSEQTVLGSLPYHRPLQKYQVPDLGRAPASLEPGSTRPRCTTSFTWSPPSPQPWPSTANPQRCDHTFPPMHISHPLFIPTKAAPSTPQTTSLIRLHPRICALSAPLKPTSLPLRIPYSFVLFLPDEWNERFLAVRNSGYSDGINWIDVGNRVEYGFAVVSTGTGHNSEILPRRDLKMDRLRTSQAL